jgi:hypothetical protein
MQTPIRVSSSESNHKKENQLVPYVERLKNYPGATVGMAGPLPVTYIYIYIL